MAKPTPFLAAVAWGLVPGPAFDAQAERFFKQRLNRELKRHRLWVKCVRILVTNRPGPGVVQQRTWQLMNWHDKREVCRGRLDVVTRHAYHRIHGGDDAGLG